MKVDQISRIFCPELRPVITSGKEEESENKFAEHIFQSQNCELNLALYHADLEKRNEELLGAKKLSGQEKKNIEQDRDTLQRLVEKFSTAFGQAKSKLSEEAQLTCEKICKIAVQGKKKKDADDKFVLIDGVKVREEELIPKDFIFEAIPEGELKLSELREQLNDEKFMEGLWKSVSEKSHKFKHKQLNARPEVLLKLQATEALFGKKQNYFMLACPKNMGLNEEFFHLLLKKKIKVIVSLNEAGEGKKPVFWVDEVVKKLKLNDGWKLSQDKKKAVVLAEGYDEKNCKVLKIVERPIVCQKGKKKHVFTHLHYEGWLDCTPCPDLKLLNVLLKRVEKLQHKDVPFSTNCQHGVGRTGIVVVTNFIRRHIEKQLKDGVKLEDITINIPEIVYEFRKHRSSMVGRKEQFFQLFEIVAALFEELTEAHSSP